MAGERTIFAQFMSYACKKEFARCVERYEGNKWVKSFSCWDQFLCMAFGQLTYRESLRDTVACLRAMSNRLYHSGIRGKVSRNTLSNANSKRDWRIFRDFAYYLIGQARELYQEEDFGVELENTVYALDATIIDLCISLYPWAKFRKQKSGIKLHTLIDLRGNIPVFIDITGANYPDMKVLDKISLEPGAFYVMDKGYVDCRRLHRFTIVGAWFVTRIKKNMPYRRLYSNQIDRDTGLRCDQTIKFSGKWASKDYPKKLRLVRYYDEDNQRYFSFITNNFELSALHVAQLYRSRWQIELFFKWIKQHLRIKQFYGENENAVKAQISIAIASYVLVAIAKKNLELDISLYNILQILSVTIFEKTPILQAFRDPDYTNQLDPVAKQLELFSI